jgi:signal transduction histidine kinase/ligand-binding sensor domain-containing protein
MWAGVVGGFVRLEGQHWHRIRTDWNYPSKSAWTMVVDRRGTLWVATGERIMFLPKGERKFRDTGLQAGQAYAFTQAPDGTLFFYDNDRDSLSTLCAPIERCRAWPIIRIPAMRILFDRDGAMWIAGYGLSRVAFPKRIGLRPVSQHTSGIETFTQKQGLTGNIVETLLEDREGNIWVGTDGGLERFRYRNLDWFPLSVGDSVYSLVAGNHGDVWTGSNGGRPLGIMRVQDGKLAPGGPNSVFVTYRDPEGVIWVSGQHALFQWKGSVFTEIRLPEQAEKMYRSPTRDPIRISSITKDRTGTLWVAIGGLGEFQLQNGVWNFLAVMRDHPDWASNEAYTDTSDRVWLAYGDRVAAVSGGRATTYSADDGLNVGPFTVIDGRNTEIGVGGERGFAFLSGDRFHTLRLADGAALGPISGIVLPANDGVWLSAGAGIVHVPESEVQQALRNFDYKVHYENFDFVSDLPAPLQRAGNGEYSSTAIQASDGILWFATQGGVARVDPRHILRNPMPPPVVIRSFVADGRSYSTFRRERLPALTRNLRVDYTALSLMVPERVRFRYKLEGRDSEWQEVGSQRQAFYTDLRPKSYIFRVVACNNDGVWNDGGATLEFSIAPAWFQTDWFHASYVLAGLLIAWVIYRIRMRQVARSLRARFDERLSERTRLARELHDTLLQTIQGSKMVADDALDGPSDPARLRRSLEHLSTWLGQAMQEGRAALNSLRASTVEANDLAGGLRRAMETQLIPSSMTANLSVIGNAREMHQIIRDEIYRIGLEAIRNACLHSRASRLEVELRYANGLALRVKDNGIGMDPVLSEKGKYGHFGLQGMRERAARIGANFRLTSSTASGTDIMLVVPGAVVFRHGHGTPLAKIKSVLKRMLHPFEMGRS